jgi:hypothetical protein
LKSLAAIVFGATSFAGKLLCRYLVDEFGFNGRLGGRCWPFTKQVSASARFPCDGVAQLPLESAYAADEAALAKAQNRRLADGARALIFRGLLTHFATIVRNTMRPKDAKPGMGSYTLTTGANPKQRQAFDLAAAIAV